MYASDGVLFTKKAASGSKIQRTRIIFPAANFLLLILFEIDLRVQPIVKIKIRNAASPFWEKIKNLY